MYPRPRAPEVKFLAFLLALVFVFSAAPAAFAVGVSPVPQSGSNTYSLGVSCDPTAMAIDLNVHLWVTDGSQQCGYPAQSAFNTSVVATYTDMGGFLNPRPATGLVGFMSTPSEVSVNPSYLNPSFISGPSCGPSGIAFNSTDYVFVADSCDGTVRAFAPSYMYAHSGTFYPNGPVLNLTGFATGPGCGVSAIAIDQNDSLYVADNCPVSPDHGGYIDVFPAVVGYAEAPTALYLINSTSHLGCPSGLAFNATGALFVADPCAVSPYNAGQTGGIVVYDCSCRGGGTPFNHFNDGATSMVGFVSGPTSPFNVTAVAISPTGTLWGADPSADEVFNFTAPYALAVGPGTPVLGSSSGLGKPTALAFDEYGTLLVADGSHRRIFSFMNMTSSSGTPPANPSPLTPHTYSASGQASVSSYSGMISFSTTYSVPQANSFVVLVASSGSGLTGFGGTATYGCTPATGSTAQSLHEATLIAICPHQSSGSHFVLAQSQIAGCCIYGGSVSISAFVFPPGNYSWQAVTSTTPPISSTTPLYYSTAQTASLTVGTTTATMNTPDGYGALSGIEINGTYTIVAGAGGLGNCHSCGIPAISLSSGFFNLTTATASTIIGNVLLGPPTLPVTSGSQYSVNVQVFSPTGAVVPDAVVDFAGQTGYPGIGNAVTFYAPSPGTYPITVTSSEYPTYTGTVTVSAFSTNVAVDLGATGTSGSGSSSGSAGTFTSSSGASQVTESGLTAVSAAFTNTATTTQTVDAWFVWSNSANQVVNIGEQLNVQFAPGQTIAFTGSYAIPGTYTVKVFIQGIDGSGLSASYSTQVIVPGP